MSRSRSGGNGIGSCPIPLETPGTGGATPKHGGKSSDLLRRLEDRERRRTAFINAGGDLHEAFVDDALAHTAIAINTDITAHIVIDSDTAIDININAASDIAISAAATIVRGQAPSSPPHASACT